MEEMYKFNEYKYLYKRRAINMERINWTTRYSDNVEFDKQGRWARVDYIHNKKEPNDPFKQKQIP